MLSPEEKQLTPRTRVNDNILVQANMSHRAAAGLIGGTFGSVSMYVQCANLFPQKIHTSENVRRHARNAAFMNGALNGVICAALPYTTPVAVGINVYYMCVNAD
jgi:hypothetical protein